MLGGGMRQAGVLAAHGLVVLDHHVEKLPLDHQNAKSLARGLSSIRGVSIEGGVDSVETNIMFVRLGDVSVAQECCLSASTRLNSRCVPWPVSVQEYGVGSAAKLSARLKQEHNILINAYGDQRLRAVTHHQVKSVDIEKVVAAVEKVLKTFV
jgi:threonine aldolase